MGLSDEIPPIQIGWFETFWKNALFNGVHDVFFLEISVFFFGTHISEIIGSRCSPATPLGMTFYQEVMQDLLAKMVLCAPTTWFQVVTGHPCISEQESYDSRWVLFFVACVCGTILPEHGLMSSTLVRWVDLFDPYVFLWWGSQRKS